MKIKILTFGLFLTTLMPFVSMVANAQVPEVNVKDPKFHLTTCDGPGLPPAQKAAVEAKTGHPYIVCDFPALMNQAQYLINVMMVVGVFAAMIGFAYTGYLYISGSQDNRSKAKGILPKLVWGFVIMLGAWFAVYQILQWLTPNAGAYMNL